jgi:hypothetical protein
MAGIDRILDGVRDVIKMTDEIRRLSEGMKELAVEVRDMGRRLIRVDAAVLRLSDALAEPGKAGLHQLNEKRKRY